MKISTLGCLLFVIFFAGCGPKQEPATETPAVVNPVERIATAPTPSKVAPPAPMVEAAPAAVESVAAPQPERDPESETTSTGGDNQIRILAWNIESEGADPKVIATQLLEMPRYDIYGFTEVHPREWKEIKSALGKEYDFWYSNTGYNDRTAYVIRKERFDILSKDEMGSFDGIVLNPGNYRSPHVYELRDKQTSKVFTMVLNHLARGKAKIRQQQAEGLRRWAKALDRPIVAIGDYNFDYVFETEKGNAAFDVFLSDDTFVWVKPQPLIDSNWYDGDGDGVDDYPGSILDFAFVAGDAKSWNPESRVVVRDGDFPDDKSTSDHRPIELTLSP